MKNILLLLSLCVVSFVQAQDTKYQGLLWEITGNGIEKPSYLYGTMHVSRKIAFNLDDIFFESLEKADMVAVESMPDNWLDNLFERGEIGYGGSITGNYDYYGNYRNNNFYSTAFKINFPDKKDIVRSLVGQSQLINGLLYRSEGLADFEEDTYLDMFIYQTGKRFNKETYSLEDNRESRDLVEKAMQNAQKKEIDEWFKKLTEKKNIRPFDLIQDAYRDRNIGLIDSVNRALYTNHYMEYMLFKRNVNMVDSMETLMRKGSLFTGVGAAHLPGENGMIDLLRKRGYTLRPLFSDQTPEGKKIKNKFEANFVNKKYETQTTGDGFITLNAPNKLYELYSEGGSVVISPDYDNGAYLAITRIYTYNLLRKPSEQLTENDLNKLLFEFIPGDITSKILLEKPYPGFDIENITKTGHHQHYQFYVTPLEIIIIKMDGKKEFVKNESAKVFSSIQFNTKEENRKVKSYFGGFELETKGYTIINNLQYRGDRFIQTYDEGSGNYAFFATTQLNDLTYIEEDSFELNYIMEQFCENMKTDLAPNGKYVPGVVPAFYGTALLDSSANKQLFLNTQLLGERYFLAGFLGDEKAAEAFFKNIKVQPFQKYETPFEERIDTSLFYTVNAPERIKVVSYPSYYEQEDKKNYEGFSKEQSYSLNSNEIVLVRLEKFHDWTMLDNIDSLWVNKERNMDKEQLKLKEKSIYEKDNAYYFEGLAVRDNSGRGIKFKYIQKNGSLYLLRALVHQGLEMSSFTDTFFKTFTPKDTIIGISPFEDKTPLFLAAIDAQDSILLEATDFIEFKNKDFETIKDIFLEKEFDEDWQFIKNVLFKEICRMDFEIVMPFLEKLYIDSYENSDYQIGVLNTLIQQKTKVTHQKAITLLQQDIPISNRGGSFLWSLLDSSKIANPLVPELLNFSNITYYKVDIQSIVAQLVTHGELSPKKYKSYKKQFLYEGKIELKREIGKERKTKNKNYYNYEEEETVEEGYYNYEEEAVEEGYYYSSSDDEELSRYIMLLYPFRKEKQIADFLNKAKSLQNNDIQMLFLMLQLKNKETVDRAIVQKMAENPKYHFEIFNLLKSCEALDLMADSLQSNLALIKTLLHDNLEYNQKLDTIYHLKTETMTVDNKLQTVHYFFRRTISENAYDSDEEENVQIIAILKNKDEEISPYNFYELTEELEDDDTEEKVIKKLSKRIQLRYRQRVNSYSSYSRFGF